MNTTGEGLLAPPARAPGCRFPPKPAEGAVRGRGGAQGFPFPHPAHPEVHPAHLPISMGFSCRLSELPESGACVPKAALRSRSVRRPVLRDLQGEVRGSDEPTCGSRVWGPALHDHPTQLLPTRHTEWHSWAPVLLPTPGAVTVTPQQTGSGGATEGPSDRQRGSHPLTCRRGPWCPPQAAGQGPAAVPGRALPPRGQAACGSEAASQPHPAGPGGSAGSGSWASWGSRTRARPRRGSGVLTTACHQGPTTLLGAPGQVGKVGLHL